MSDRYLTQHCRFLELLQTGDLVLADRGFNIEEDLNFYGAKLAIPAYTRGKKQLSLEVELYCLYNYSACNIKGTAWRHAIYHS